MVRGPSSSRFLCSSCHFCGSKAFASWVFSPFSRANADEFSRVDGQSVYAGNRAGWMTVIDAEPSRAAHLAYIVCVLYTFFVVAVIVALLFNKM